MKTRSLLFLMLIIFSSACHAQKTDITDSLLRKIFPDYPLIQIFRPEFLDFFSDNPDRERSRRGADIGSYVLEGDFDNDGMMEVAIAGLLLPDPVDGKYNAFITILDMKSKHVEFFQKLKKTVENPMSIQNLILFHEKDGRIRIGFQYETDFMGMITFNDKYSISTY